jgi:uncharacterized protein
LRFWDSSALVTLHVAQAATPVTRRLYEADPVVLAWVLSDVEMRSAVCRLEREGTLSAAAARDAGARLADLWEAVHVVGLTDGVKARAKRLLGLHTLRAADALQLAAALASAREDPTGSEFVCLDDRLGSAAAREGFDVLP